MMKFAVTGAKGFLGSVFCHAAMDHGHKVWGLDDESRGLNKVEQLLRDNYRRHDCRKGIVQALPDVKQIDAVIHFAAATGSLERPIEELRVWNVDMTKHVYQDALRLGAKAFIWPTTSLALGVPDSPYVISKEEALAMLKEVDVAARISVPCRFFNVTGVYAECTERRKNEVHILPTMLECYRQGKVFTINGTDYTTTDGSPSRDFVDVYDVVCYLLRLARMRCNDRPIEAHPKDGAVWIGTGTPTTVRQVVQLFTSAIGALTLIYGPRRPYDCGELRIDATQQHAFTRIVGRLTPSATSIKRELQALMRHPS